MTSTSLKRFLGKEMAKISSAKQDIMHDEITIDEVLKEQDLCYKCLGDGHQLGPPNATEYTYAICNGTGKYQERKFY